MSVEEREVLWKLTERNEAKKAFALFWMKHACMHRERVQQGKLREGMQKGIL